MISKAYASVWDAIEPTPAAAAKMKARSTLMMAVQQSVDLWDVTPAQAAKRLKITRPRLADLRKGRIAKFNLESLVSIATRAGLNVTIKVKKKAA